MDFPMTRDTYNFQIFNFIIFPIFIFMMNFQFAVLSFTIITVMGKCIESKFSITRDPSYIRGMIFQSRVFSFFFIISNYFFIHAFFRTCESMIFTWPNIKSLITFSAYFFNFFSCIEFMKTSFATKNVPIISRIHWKYITTLFAAFRFSGFDSRSRIASFRAKFLPLIISRNFLCTLIAVHAH